MNQMEIFKNPEFAQYPGHRGRWQIPVFWFGCGKCAWIQQFPRFNFQALAGTSRNATYPIHKNSGKTIQMTFIPEGDVYRLIVHSKLPSAERFERWVFDEVLPSIRQHGAYLTRGQAVGGSPLPRKPC